MTTGAPVTIPVTPTCDAINESVASGIDRDWTVPPSLAGTIELVEEIHTGGEGTVYLVRQIADGLELALKIYRPAFARLDDATLELISRIDRDHVVELYEFGHDDVWWELMEYCPNGSLRDLLNETGPVASRDAAELVREIADGLEAIRASGIVHGDLRPVNILFRRRRPADLILADFGRARILNQHREHQHGGLGTTAYQPPESVTSNTVTVAHDYWSLGVIIYETLTGEHPFATESEDATVFSIGFRPVDLSAIEDIDWRYLLGGLLVKDPDERWGAEQVTGWLEHSRPDLPKESPFYTTGFQFRGEWYHAPEALGRSIAGEWAYGMELVSGDRSFELLSDWLVSRRDTAAATFADTMESHDRGPDYRVAALVSFLDPDLPPVFHDHAVGYEHLAGLAAAAVKKPSSTAAQDVSDLYRSHVLAAYGPSDQRLPELDMTWHEAVSEFEQHAAAATESGLPAPGREEMQLVRARALHVLVHPPGLARLRKQVDRRTRKTAIHEDWFQQIVDDHGDSVGGLLAIATYAGPVSGRVRHRRTETEADRDRTRAGVVQTNYELARGSIRRYFTVAAALTLPAAYVAGELTFKYDGGFGRGLLVCAAAATLAVVLMIGTDFLMARRPTQFENPPVGRWIYLLTGGIGLAAWGMSAGSWVDLPSPTVRGWFIPPLAVALGHVFVRAPSETREGRGRAPWERNVLRYAGLPVGAALILLAMTSIPDGFIDRARYAAEWGDPTVLIPERDILAVVLWALVVGLLVATAGFRERHEGGWRSFFGFVIGVTVMASALYVLLPWETPGSAEMWAITAAWVGTGLQLVIRYRPPRVFWLVTGVLGLGGVLHHLMGIVPALASGVPITESLVYLTWALASIRLMGVGGEDLI